jgi:RIO-like serine/threonine protein kinase
MVATMEYFNGKTLNDFIIGRNAKQVCNILQYYLYAIEQTSKIDIFHGDAHENNVLIRESIIDYDYNYKYSISLTLKRHIKLICL